MDDVINGRVLLMKVWQFDSKSFFLIDSNFNENVAQKLKGVSLCHLTNRKLFLRQSKA